MTSLLLALMLLHHGTGTYDSTKSVTLSGTVTEFAFTNPHAALFFDVKDANGKIVNWAIEMNSPGVLARAGWTKRMFKAGDQITAKGIYRDPVRVAVQVVKTGITPPLAPADRVREAETGRLHPAERLHTLQ